MTSLDADRANAYFIEQKAEEDQGHCGAFLPPPWDKNGIPQPIYGLCMSTDLVGTMRTACIHEHLEIARKCETCFRRVERFAAMPGIWLICMHCLNAKTKNADGTEKDEGHRCLLFAEFTYDDGRKIRLQEANG